MSPTTKCYYCENTAVGLIKRKDVCSLHWWRLKRKEKSKERKLKREKSKVLKESQGISI